MLLLIKAVIEYYVYFALLFHARSLAGLLSFIKKVALYNLYFTRHTHNHKSKQIIHKHTG